jgi:hypothetical protein
MDVKVVWELCHSERKTSIYSPAKLAVSLLIPPFLVDRRPAARRTHFYQSLFPKSLVYNRIYPCQRSFPLRPSSRKEGHRQSCLPARIEEMGKYKVALGAARLAGRRVLPGCHRVQRQHYQRQPVQADSDRRYGRCPVCRVQLGRPSDEGYQHPYPGQRRILRADVRRRRGSYRYDGSYNLAYARDAPPPPSPPSCVEPAPAPVIRSSIPVALAVGGVLLGAKLLRRWRQS